MNNELANKEYWEQSWKKSNKLEVTYNKNPFEKQFSKHISADNGGEYALEIGCVPGIFLGHLGKDFGFNVEGIDYVEGAAQTTTNTLQKFGIENAKIYEEDFLRWTPPRLYDLTCSFGFIEHFLDVDPVVDKHVEALRPGGTLILEIPNFSGLQFWLHYFLDRQNLERHNTKIMNLEYFYATVQRHKLSINCLEYTGGLFDFWWENERPSGFQKIVFNILRPLAFLGRRIPLKCRFSSPFIILVAKK